MNLTQNEPVAVAGVVALLVGAVVAALAAWGVVVSPEQKDSIIGLLVAVYTVGGLVAAWWARKKVTPTATAQKAVDAAFVATPGVDAKPTLASGQVAK